MIITDPSEYLLIIAKNPTYCHQYTKEQNLTRYYLKNHVHYASTASRCMGYKDVDIMFAPGWWETETKRELLDVLMTYLSTMTGKIVGDRAVVPTFLLLRNDMMAKKRVEEIFDPIESRFEILDL